MIQQAAPLYGFKEAPVAIEKETPRARTILYMKAQGMSNKNIAAALGVNIQTVSYTVRQRWFMEQLVLLLKEAGQDKVEKLLNNLAIDAVQIAYEVMLEAKEKGDGRLAKDSAFGLLTAARGTKVVVEDSKNKPSTELNEEIKEIEDEIKGLTEQPSVQRN